MFILNLKIALRNLWKNKGFTLINVGGLAIGLSCCLMLLLYVGYQWNYDKQFKNINQIYSVYDNDLMSDQIITNRAYCTPNQLAATVKQSIPGVEQVTRLAESGGLVKYGQNSFNKKLIFVDPSFLKIFDYKFIKGDPATALNDPNSVLITEQTAHIFFGDENPIGKTLNFENRKNLLVTAVIKNLPANQSYQFDMLMPWTSNEQDNEWLKRMDWTDGALNTIVQLKKDADPAAADAQMRVLFDKQKPGVHSIQFFLFPFKKAYLFDQFENGKLVGGKIDQLKLYFLLAICVLVIACINYMNLSTARSEKRAREVGIRKTLGSSRKSLSWQFLLESVLLSFIAMLIAFTLLELSLPYFNNLLNTQIIIDYRSYTTWLTLVILVFVTGVLAGSYPSFYLSSFQPVRVLKGIIGAGKGSLSVRKLLVVVQFTCSISIIICAIIIHNQLQYLSNKPLGFNKDNLVQIARTGTLRDNSKLALYKSELIKSGAIVSATITTNGVTNNYVSTEKIKWPGQQLNEMVSMKLRFCGYDYSTTIESTMLRGRDFSPAFGNDSSSVILNETAVKAMNLKDPVGTQIKNEDWGKTFTVVGVMKDYNFESLGSKVSPVLFFYDKDPNTVVMRLNPERSAGSSIAEIKSLTTKLNPEYPYELYFVSDLISGKVNNERLMSTLSNFFGGFAIFISCLGLVGLALYMAEQRSKEISIRKVLGAELGNILLLLNKDFLKLVIIANVIACLVAYILAKSWLQKYDYKTDMTLWPFLTATGLSMIVAFCAVSLQIFKVARAKPIDALKYE